MKKAIRIDSQNNERIVLNALVEFNVVKTDIVPLLLSYRNQRTEVADRFILACGIYNTNAHYSAYTKYN